MYSTISWTAFTGRAYALRWRRSLLKESRGTLTVSNTIVRLIGLGAALAGFTGIEHYVGHV